MKTKRNSNVVSALLSGFSVAEDALATSMDSAGSAMQENEIYLDSVTGRIQTLKASAEGFAESFVDDTILKFVIELANGLVDIGTDLNKIHVLLPGIAAGIAAIQLGKTNSKIQESAAGIKSIITTISESDISKISPSELAKNLTSNYSGLTQEAQTYLTSSKQFKEALEAFSGKELNDNELKAFINGLKGIENQASETADAVGEIGASAKTFATLNKGITAVTIALTAATVAYTVYQSYVQKVAEQMQALADASEELYEQEDSVEDYKTKILELRDAIDSGNLTEQEAYDSRKQLLEIQDEVIDKLGDEAGAFDILKDEIDDVNESLDTTIAKKAYALLYEDSDYTSTMNWAIPEYEKTQNWSTGTFSGTPGLKENKDGSSEYYAADVYDRIYQIYKDVFGEEFVTKNFSGGVVSSQFEIVVTADVESVSDGIDEVTEKLDAYDKELKQAGDGNSLDKALGLVNGSWRSTIGQMASDVNDFLENNDLQEVYYDIAKNKILASSETGREYQNVISDMAEAQEKYNDAISRDYDNEEDRLYAIKDALDDYQTAYSKTFEEEFFRDDGSDTGVQKYIENIYDEFQAAVAQYQFRIDVEFESPSDVREDAVNTVKNFINSFEGEDGTIKASTVSKKYDELTSSPDESDALQNLNDALDLLGLTLDDAMLSLDGWNDFVYDLVTITNTATTSVVEFTEAVDELTKANDVLTAAQEDMNENGSLSYDTLQSLMEVTDDWISYLTIEDGQLKLNVKAWNDLTESKRLASLETYKSNIAELQSEKDAVDSKIANMSGYGKLTDTGESQLASLTEESNRLGKEIEETTIEMDAYTIVTQEAADTTEDTTEAFADFEGTIDDFGSKFNEAKSNIESINDAIEEYGDKEVLTEKETAELISQFPSLMTQLTKTEGGYKLNADALQTLKDAEISEVSTMMQAEIEKARQILTSTDTITASLIDQIEAFETADAFMQQYLSSASAAGLKASTVAAMQGLDVTKIDVANKTYTLSNGELFDISGSEYSDLLNWGQTYANAQNLQELIDGSKSYDSESALASWGTSTTGTSSGSSSSEETAQEQLQEALDATIANLDHNIFLLEQIGGKEDEIRALLDKEQEVYAYYGQAFRALGEGEDSEYVRGASEGWWGVEDSKYSNFQSMIGNIDHEIALLEQQGDKQEELIALYKEKQVAEEEYAAYLRSYGMENSAAAQELGEQWWSEQESINSLYSELYDQAINDSSYRIAGLQRTENGGATQNAQEIISIYKDMMASTYAEIERYTELGAEKYSEEIQSLQESAWGFKDEIDAVLESLVSDASSALDTAQSLYDTLLSAGNEYATNGYLSIDTYQQLLSLGPEYLAYLIDENGQLTINEERVQALIKAKTEQYGIQTALNYVTSLQTAIDDNNTEALNRLLYATEAVNASTWELVYSQIYLMNLTDEQRDAAIGVIQGIQSVCDSAVTSITHISDEANDAVEELKAELEDLEDMQEGVNDILDLTMDMVQDMVEQEIDGIEELKDQYSELIEAKKESLQATKDEDDYEKSKANQIKSIAKLQEQIDLLSLDDSREAQAERASLMEEMAELQDELAEDQADYALDKTLDSLDEMEEAYEKEKDDEIAILEDSISSTQKIYEKAIAYIEDNWDTLYEDLINWNYQYGSTLETDLVDSWSKAYAAAEKYGSLVTAIAQIETDVLNKQEEVDAAGDETNYVRSDNGNIVISDKTTDTSAEAAKKAAEEAVAEAEKSEAEEASSNEAAIKNIVSIMKQNAAKWNELYAEGDSTLAVRNLLASKNVELGNSLAAYGITATRDDDGVWYVETASGRKKLFDIYHSGGVVGGGNAASDEQLALLKKNEWVLTEGMANNLTHMMDLIDMLGRASLKLGSSSKILQNGFSETIASGMASLNNITTNQPIQITFGDTIINGTDGSTIEQHVAVDRDMVNQIAKILKVKL